MMETKGIFKNATKYLRELSVVIVGIAITFGLSDWIGNRNEKKEIRKSLELVKMELEDNLSIVHEQYEFYDQTKDFAFYLLSSGKQENLRTDSLAKYDDVIRNIKFRTYKTSAFEMLKISGTMRLIKDKELLKSIIDCYDLMEYAKSIGDKEMIIKADKLRKTIEENGINNAVFDLRMPGYKPLFDYFATYTGNEKHFRACEEQIEKTLILF